MSLLPARKPIRWSDLAVAAVEVGTVYLSFNRLQSELDRSLEALTEKLAEEVDDARLRRTPGAVDSS